MMAAVCRCYGGGLPFLAFLCLCVMISGSEAGGNSTRAAWRNSTLLIIKCEEFTSYSKNYEVKYSSLDVEGDTCYYHLTNCTNNRCKETNHVANVALGVVKWVGIGLAVILFVVVGRTWRWKLRYYENRRCREQNAARMQALQNTMDVNQQVPGGGHVGPGAPPPPPISSVSYPPPPDVSAPPPSYSEATKHGPQGVVNAGYNTQYWNPGANPVEK